MIEFIDGFDHYNNATEMSRKGWIITAEYASNVIFSQTPRFTGYSIGFNQPGDDNTSVLSITKTFGKNLSTAYFGVAFYVTNDAKSKLFTFMDGSTYQIGVRINTDRTISVITNGISGTILATSTKIIPINTWTHLSMESYIHSSNGTVKVWINGELLIDLSGQNTKQSANAYVNAFRVYTISVAFTTTLYIDDFYYGSNLGSVNTSCPTEARVTALYPMSSGTYNEWSYSGTTYAWQGVDDATPDASTYIYSSVSGTRETFAFGDLEADVDGVFAVQFINYGKKTDADTRATKFIMGLPSGTFYPFGTGSYLGSDYQFFTYVQENDPITAGALDATIINNNEYGVIVHI